MTAPSLDFAPFWEIAKGVMLTGITAGVGWMIKKLIAIDSRQVRHEYILVGENGKNGLKSDVNLLVRRVDAIEDRNIAIDAVTRADRENHPGPDRRAGARRMLDVVHEAYDERLKQLPDPDEE